MTMLAVPPTDEPDLLKLVAHSHALQVESHGPLEAPADVCSRADAAITRQLLGEQDAF